jgi:prophage regulatory protein
MQLLRRSQVVARTGLSYPTIYRYELRGEFPARRRIGPNSVGWLAHEVDAWIESRSVVRNTHVDDAPSSQAIQSSDSA